MLKAVLVVALMLLLKTGVFAAESEDSDSTLISGVQVVPEQSGIKVVRVLSTDAAGPTLQAGDILMKATVDGRTFFSLSTLKNTADARTAIGSDRKAAVQFHRPGAGQRHTWIQFQPATSASATTRTPEPAMFQPGSETDKSCLMFEITNEEGAASSNTQAAFTSTQSHARSPFVAEQHTEKEATELFQRKQRQTSR